MKTKTCYMPFRSNNLYSDNIMHIIRNSGYEVLSIRQCIKNPLNFIGCKIFNLNWFENFNNHSSAYFQYVKKVLFIYFLKLFRKKLVYTLHNKQPHNMDNNTYAIKIMRLLMKKADTIVAMCMDTRLVVEEICPDCVNKICYVPHPNYINNYTSDAENSREQREKMGFEQGDCVFMILGFISPYKNVELLIDTICATNNPKIKLLIAGKVSDNEYKSKLENMIVGKNNIVADFRYIPDSEVGLYYSVADVIVLPYQKKSTLNSGAAYLSFSLKKTVICPCIGTINDLKQKDFVYSYNYDSEEQHKECLRETVDRVCKDFSDNADAIREKGEAAYEYVSMYHSDLLVQEKYSEIYSELT